MEKIFISYSYKDKPNVDKFIKELQDQGVVDPDTTWLGFQEEDFVAGSNLREMLRDKIEQANKVVLIWTDASSHSQYVHYEAGIAEALGKPIITVVPEDSEAELPPNLSDVTIVKVSHHG